MKICKWFKNLFRGTPGTREEKPHSAVPEKSGLSDATHIVIYPVTKNWDADAEKDGIDIEINLRDEEDRNIDFEEGSFSGKIIIKTESGNDVYNKPVSVTRRIRIPFEEIAAADGREGILYIEVTLPDGRILAAQEKYVRIKK